MLLVLSACILVTAILYSNWTSPGIADNRQAWPEHALPFDRTARQGHDQWSIRDFDQEVTSP